LGTPKDYTLIDTTAVKWTLTVQTTFNEDTGDQTMRWTHSLEAGILKTDKVMFEIDFITGLETD